MSINAELVDVRKYGFKITGDGDRKLQKKMKEAKAFMIVAPEYNHGYPGELKLLLDAFYLDEYENKPVLICPTSSGSHGGAAMAEQLKAVCITLGMIPVRETIFFNNLTQLFDKNLNMKDKDLDKKIEVIIKEFYSRIQST